VIDAAPETIATTLARLGGATRVALVAANDRGWRAMLDDVKADLEEA
jgi:hypothetical protein